jgi:hypothetical protein
MKRFSLVLILLIIMPSFSSAEWLMLPLEELVCDSDLIVVGTLTSVSEYSKNGMDYAQGMITVDETIWGAVTPGETLTLKWDNPSNLKCPRVGHGHNSDKKGIWLLTLSSDREVRANHPGRFVELDRKEEVVKILSQKNICTRIDTWSFFSGEPATVSLVLRNPTQGEMRFPGLAYQDGRLYISPDVTLTLHNSSGENGKEIDHLSDRVFVSYDVAPISVGGNQEHKITLDLRRIFDLNAEDHYTLRFKVKGFEPGNDCRFYFSPTARPDRSGSGEEKNAEAKTTPVYKARSALWPTLGIIGALGSFSLYRRRARK